MPRLLVLSLIVLLTAVPVAPLPGFLDGLSGRPVVAAAPSPWVVVPASGTELVFDDAYLGSGGSRELTVQIGNGTTDTLTDVVFGGGQTSSADFGMHSEGCDSRTFVPGQWCKFRYSFTPTRALDHPLTANTIINISWVSTLTHHADSQQLTYSFRGTALFPLGMAPSKLDFGTVPWSATADRTAKITNTSPVTITPPPFIMPNIPPNGAFVITDSPIPSSLPPGASFDLNVRFDPQKVSLVGVASVQIGLGIYDRILIVTATGCGVRSAGQACGAPTSTGTHTSPVSSGVPSDRGGVTTPPVGSVTPSGTVSSSSRASGSVVVVGDVRPTSGSSMGMVVVWTAVVLLLLAVAVALLLWRGGWRWHWLLARLGRRGGG
jgi:hypothetical protein